MLLLNLFRKKNKDLSNSGSEKKLPELDMSNEAESREWFLRLLAIGQVMKEAYEKKEKISWFTAFTRSVKTYNQILESQKQLQHNGQKSTTSLSRGEKASS